VPPGDHVQEFFSGRCLEAAAIALDEEREDLESRADRSELDPQQVENAHRRLAKRFRVEITSFERKGYANLSHAPNKAMNLNAFLSLMGRRLVQEQRADGVHLVDAPEGEDAEVVVPDADYVITLDADSILLPEYAQRLIELAERPGNERLAVLQTPYSAFPGAPTVMERVAGATTDLQYIIHQGFTRWGATYWVGANALLRVEALRDIAFDDNEGGLVVRKYVSDRTVIEDTESSIDLAARGWCLYNHPERLAYSATPPDLGSLAIQRSRWANGGLIILPKALRYLRAHGFPARKRREAFFRIHYLASTAFVNAAVVILLAFPFETALRSWWLPVAAAPYFVLQVRDLVRLGYRATDLPRIYALNLLLIPINLEGALASLRQACTGRKSAFRRTPKARDRTIVELRHIAAYAALIGLMLWSIWTDADKGYWIHASFVLANLLLLLHGLGEMVGLGNIGKDIRFHLSAGR
jgi:hypothetical protein